MNRVRTFFFLSMMTWATACSSFTVTSAYEPTVNFSQMRTYDWMPRNEITDKPPETAIAAQVGQLIKEAVENGMTKRGYVKRSGENPDFFLAYHASVEDKVEPRVADYYCGTRICNQGITIDRYREGTLVLDIIKADSKEVVWRGTAVGIVGDPTKRKALIDESVNEILNQFPPKK
jgi:hypothetical protein